MLTRLNKGVEGYDIDYQYEILIKVVEHEQEVAAAQKREKWYNIFRGVNGVSSGSPVAENSKIHHRS